MRAETSRVAAITPSYVAYDGSGSRISSPFSASRRQTANSAACAPGRNTTWPAPIGRLAYRSTWRAMAVRIDSSPADGV